MSYLQPATWRVLGLSVAATYTGIGLYEMLMPRKASRNFMDIPKKKTPESEETAGQLWPLIGARDLSMAAAMYTFYFTGQDRELGVVILSGNFFCVVDTVALWLLKGPVP